MQSVAFEGCSLLTRTQCGCNTVTWYSLWVLLDSRASQVHQSSVFVGPWKCYMWMGWQGTAHTDTVCVFSVHMYAPLPHWLHLQNTSSKIKGTRILIWQQPDIKPSVGPFWELCPEPQVPCQSSHPCPFSHVIMRLYSYASLWGKCSYHSHCVDWDTEVQVV